MNDTPCEVGSRQYLCTLSSSDMMVALWGDENYVQKAARNIRNTVRISCKPQYLFVNQIVARAKPVRMVK